jgi:hypothetical protein
MKKRPNIDKWIKNEIDDFEVLEKEPKYPFGINEKMKEQEIPPWGSPTKSLGSAGTKDWVEKPSETETYRKKLEGNIITITSEEDKNLVDKKIGDIVDVDYPFGTLKGKIVGTGKYKTHKLIKIL